MVFLPFYLVAFILNIITERIKNSNAFVVDHGALFFFVLWHLRRYTEINPGVA